MHVTSGTQPFFSLVRFLGLPKHKTMELGTTLVLPCGLASKFSDLSTPGAAAGVGVVYYSMIII